MSRHGLIRENLWSQYSQKVHDRMENPRFRGVITEQEAADRNLRLIIAHDGAASCGDSMTMFWLVDDANDRIVDARFQSFGCGTAISAADATCELCIGKTVLEARALTNLDVERFLRDEDGTPAVPPQKMHCSVLAYEVIRNAYQQYTGHADAQDDDIVCECARVRVQTVRDAIRQHDLTTLEQIVQHTKAGGFCKSCQKPWGHEARSVYLIDILEQTRKEMAQESESRAGNPLLSRFEQSSQILEQIHTLGTEQKTA